MVSFFLAWLFDSAEYSSVAGCFCQRRKMALKLVLRSALGSEVIDARKHQVCHTFRQEEKRKNKNIETPFN